jgi:hypothetical protein
MTSKRFGVPPPSVQSPSWRQVQVRHSWPDPQAGSAGSPHVSPAWTMPWPHSPASVEVVEDVVVDVEVVEVLDVDVELDVLVLVELLVVLVLVVEVVLDVLLVVDEEVVVDVLVEVVEVLDVEVDEEVLVEVLLEVLVAPG